MTHTWLSDPPPWLKRAVMASCVIAIALLWVNSRIFIMRRNQPGAKPVVLSGYYVYHGMAVALTHGRVGQVDLAGLQQYLALNDPLAVYPRLPIGAPHNWVSFYTLDVGYLFIVEAARLAFPAIPDNILRALALQFFVDIGTVLFVYFVFAHWSTASGLLAAAMYVTNGVFAALVAFAYYYYWDIPLTFVVLGALLVASIRPQEARRWLVLAAVVLGFGVWLRGTWWPLAACFFLVSSFSPDLRRKLVLPLVVFAIVATPQVVRSSVARGHLALSTRAVWHVAMVGLGYFPNKYGLEARDEVVFKLTREKYGIPFRSEDYYQHDQAAKKEFLSILREDPRFVVSSFLGRLRDSLLGTTKTSMFSYLFVPNVAYRLFGILCLAAMIAYGREMRLIGLAAGGMYVTYVLVTCLIYYVGLDYDNVSQVTMLVSVVGGFECVRRRVLGHTAARLART